MQGSRPRLFLCAGMQSSGSTLVSWCFLQRRDMDGFLDADNDILNYIPRAIGRPYVWYKTTLSSFRLAELVEHYEDEGWEVKPLLLIRDVRAVFSSLADKPYGRNGTTAEDPPLRLRLRRFREDWERCRDLDIPVLRYESFVADPLATLEDICRRLGLPWDVGMMTWPKGNDEVHDTRHGNATFLESRGQGLLKSLKPLPATPDVRRIPPGELAWLESEFEEFNHANGFPLHVEVSQAAPCLQRSAPCFDITRRHKWMLHQRPLRYLGYKVRTWLARAGLGKSLARAG